MSDLFGSPAEAAPFSRGPGACPLNQGVSVVDQLLAAITREGSPEELDAALDFRLILAHTSDPAAILRGYFVLRSAAEERHYLALYRLRRWLEGRFVALVQIDRSSPPRRVRMKLDATSFGALYAQCAVRATTGLPPQAWTRVHFVSADPSATATGPGQPLPIG